MIVGAVPEIAHFAERSENGIGMRFMKCAKTGTSPGIIVPRYNERPGIPMRPSPGIPMRPTNPGSWGQKGNLFLNKQNCARLRAISYVIKKSRLFLEKLH